MNYFKISELCVSDSAIPVPVADALLKYHITPMNRVREIFGRGITASNDSGYRPKHYEISKGRSGNSEHTFEQINEQGIGAIDWTTLSITEARFLLNTENNKEAISNLKLLIENDLNILESLIIDHTNYRRICRYDTFLHCDYRNIDGRRRYYYNTISGWDFIKHIEDNTRNNRDS